MTYKITERVTTLIEDLINAGYEGEATITNSYCTGTASFFDQAISVQLTGFCKECLYIAEDVDTHEIVCVGRYSLELQREEVGVPDIVQLAWDMYKTYKEYSNYGIPSEFQELFLNSGYLKQKKITKTVLEERE